MWFAWKFLSLWYQTQLIWVLLAELWVVICLKISIFVVSNTTDNSCIFSLYLLWFAWKFLSLWYQTQREDQIKAAGYSCDLLENFYLCGIKHNTFSIKMKMVKLWFAWKFLSLWYQTQQYTKKAISIARCDLLENFYLCGIKHNLWIPRGEHKVLWFAWKFLSLWYQTQRLFPSIGSNLCCDLLENFYLCGIKHNNMLKILIGISVVICLKISIFVVSNTTVKRSIILLYQLWFAWKFLSLWYQTQL